jgi:hypothetical protein
LQLCLMRDEQKTVRNPSWHYFASSVLPSRISTLCLYGAIQLCTKQIKGFPVSSESSLSPEQIKFHGDFLSKWIFAGIVFGGLLARIAKKMLNGSPREVKFHSGGCTCGLMSSIAAAVTAAITAAVATATVAVVTAVCVATAIAIAIAATIDVVAATATVATTVATAVVATALLAMAASIPRALWLLLWGLAAADCLAEHLKLPLNGQDVGSV